MKDLSVEDNLKIYESYRMHMILDDVDRDENNSDEITNTNNYEGDCDMIEENAGKWIGVEFEGYCNKKRVCTVIECSKCGKHLSVTYGINEYKLCPFCGDEKTEFVEQ